MGLLPPVKIAPPMTGRMCPPIHYTQRHAVHACRLSDLLWFCGRNIIGRLRTIRAGIYKGIKKDSLQEQNTLR